MNYTLPLFVALNLLTVMANAATFISPIAGGNCVISSDFGPRKHPILGIRKGHGAYDFSSQPRGTPLPVQASASGTIIAKEYHSEYGYYIEVQHSNGLYTRYTHLRKGSVTSLPVGASVGAGTRLGMTGSSGRATGVHLHWEVLTSPGLKGRKIDPVPQYISRQAFGCQEDDDVSPSKPAKRKRGGVQ